MNIKEQKMTIHENIHFWIYEKFINKLKQINPEVIKMGKREKIEKNVIIAKKPLIKLGNSRAVTLPATWLKIQKYLGRDPLREVAVIGNSLLIITTENEVEIAKQLLTEYEKKIKEQKEVKI
jgi:antitoxin component of MazEF toxin-antitoxin module